MTRRVQALAKGVCDQQKVAADECELLSAHAISSAAADVLENMMLQVSAFSCSLFVIV